MNILIVCAIFFSCLIIGFRHGGLGVFVLFLCAFCFVWGGSFYSETVAEKAKNGDLVNIQGKYYSVKYVKDEVKR